MVNLKRNLGLIVLFLNFYLVEKIFSDIAPLINIQATSLTGHSDYTSNNLIYISINLNGLSYFLDNSTSPAEMIISEIDNFNASKWQTLDSFNTQYPYGTVLTTFTLSVGDGLKTIYVKFKRDNRETPVFSETIVLQTFLPPNDLSKVRVFPNPFKLYTQTIYYYPKKYTPTLVFAGLTSDSVIEIYTIFGELVINLSDVNDFGQCLWDGKNKKGEYVNSGIYLYKVSNKFGFKKLGKIAIVK